MALSPNAARGLRVDLIDNTCLYKAAFIGGGELPDCLKGVYTSKKLAEKAIEDYMESKDTRNRSVKSKSN